MTIVVLDASTTVRQKIEKLILDFDCDDVDIVLFSDGAEAFDYIESEDVDIVFSSIENEGLDGVSFVDLLLRKKPYMVSKLFIVTSQKDSDTIQEIKDVGAKRFIRKPINEEYFRHHIYPEMKKILN